jgi:hypothetical protein
VPKKGNNKAKRFDLNQINLALLVTKEDGSPLMHHTYEGNRHDAKKFPEIISKLADRFVMFSKNVDKITLVFDKGNNSKKSMALLDKTSYHFVGSLKPYDYKYFLEIPMEKFQLVQRENGEENNKKDDIYAYRTQEEVLGAERTVVVTYEQKLYERNLKTGNAVMLKGGSEARNSNEALFDVVTEASVSNGIPDGWAQLLETREDVNEMLKLNEYIDLLMPRGNEEFARYIQNNTSIMVLGHSEGVCHVYVDRDADLGMAVDICYDAKVQYLGVCNAAETLVVDSAIASDFLLRMVERYLKAGVEVRGCSKTLDFFATDKYKVEQIKPASEADWHTEYNDLIISIKVVDGVDEAIEHINHYGSGHTDAIITGNKKNSA